MDEQCDQSWLDEAIVGVNQKITEAETKMETAKVNLGSLQSQQKELDKLKKEIEKACADYGLQVEALQATQGKMQAYFCDMEKTLKDCVFCFPDDVCKALRAIERNLDCKEHNYWLLTDGLDVYRQGWWAKKACEDVWEWEDNSDAGIIKLSDCDDYLKDGCPGKIIPINDDSDSDTQNEQNCPPKSLKRLEHELKTAEENKKAAEARFKAWKTISKTIGDRFKQMETLKEKICVHIKKREYAHAYYYLKVSDNNFKQLLDQQPAAVNKPELTNCIHAAWDALVEATKAYETNNTCYLAAGLRVKNLSKTIEALRKSRESDVLSCLEAINKRNDEASDCVPDKPSKDSPEQKAPCQGSPAQQSPRQDSPVQQAPADDSGPCNESGKKE